MPPSSTSGVPPRVATVVLGAALTLTQFVFAASALGASAPQPSRPPVTGLGTLAQLSGQEGCLVDSSTPRRGCRSVRALRGPAPFLGSNAVAISPDGKNVYVASSRSDAIAVFRRNARTGRLAHGTTCSMARQSATTATLAMSEMTI